MGWLNTVWEEFIGLFVDDGSLAIALLVWQGACWFTFPRLGLPDIWPPVVLFVGLILILSERVLRRARQRA